MDETTRQALAQKHYLDLIDEAQAGLERMRAAVMAGPFDVDASRQMIRKCLADTKDDALHIAVRILMDQVEIYRRQLVELLPWVCRMINAVIYGEVVERFTVGEAQALYERIDDGEFSVRSITS